jgi:DNA invertase Pin-like site-specific DNA recombinase
MKRAVLYARVSTDGPAEGTIESQVLELKRQIAAAGAVLVREYVDNGYSGTLLDRPGFEALGRDVKTPLFDAVYFLDTDRIARDVAYQTIIRGGLQADFIQARSLVRHRFLTRPKLEAGRHPKDRPLGMLVAFNQL